MKQKNMRTLDIQVKAQDSGLTIDKLIVKYAPDMSRRRIRRILDMGGIQLNSQKVRVASTKVKNKDHVVMTYSLESLQAWTQQKFSLVKKDILLFNDELLIINKPPLLASQPVKSKFASHATAVAQDFFKEQKKPIDTPILCHRLDKETSGILVFARSEVAAQYVMEQFKQKTVSKNYLAICYGLPKQKSWVVENHLSGINKKTTKVSVVKSGGKYAYTSFKVLETFEKQKLCLIECKPKTGRSHQIRVHLEAKGYPIVGDKKYGLNLVSKLPKKLHELQLSHHFLHAQQIEFVSPKEKKVSLTASLPSQFRDFLLQVKSNRIKSIQ